MQIYSKQTQIKLLWWGLWFDLEKLPIHSSLQTEGCFAYGNAEVSGKKDTSIPKIVAPGYFTYEALLERTGVDVNKIQWRRRVMEPLIEVNKSIERCKTNYLFLALIQKRIAKGGSGDLNWKNLRKASDLAFLAFCAHWCWELKHLFNAFPYDGMGWVGASACILFPPVLQPVSNCVLWTKQLLGAHWWSLHF